MRRRRYAVAPKASIPADAPSAAVVPSEGTLDRATTSRGRTMMPLRFWVRHPIAAWRWRRFTRRNERALREAIANRGLRLLEPETEAQRAARIRAQIYADIAIRDALDEQGFRFITPS